ncbi:MAG: T9SS type A sorting domain-containing protein [Flavobacteriales bacterium]|nr:T9SS type A sorting domain-containing protein [Flavobacteriales bacterium]
MRIASSLHAWSTWPLLFCAIVADGQVPFALDPTFQANFDTWYVSSVAPMSDGGVLLSGQIKFTGDMSFRGSAKLLANGQRDFAFPTFPQTTGGGKITPWNDKFYVATSQTVRRLDEEGLIDPAFIHMNSGLYFLSLQGGDYHVYPDGRILMSGAHELQDSIRGFEGLYNLIWFSNTGYLDTSKTHRTSNGVIFEIEELPNGRFICSGTCTQYEGQPTRMIFRVEADGALDPSFQSVLAFGDMDAFTPLSNGRILGTGLAMSFQGATDTTQFVRYMPDGSLDPTFNNDIVVSSMQYGRFLSLWHTRLSDGRILLQGNFDHVEGAWRSGIALLDENGELLSTAFTGTGCGNYDHNGYIYHGIQGSALLADSMMYIYGAYHGYDDGTTNDPDQRFVTRLYGPDFTARVQEQPVFAQMQVYPNPASGIVSIDVNSIYAPAELTLTDALGCIVLRQRVVGNRTNMDLSNLANGVYQIQLFASGLRLDAQWLVVEH